MFLVTNAGPQIRTGLFIRVHQQNIVPSTRTHRSEIHGQRGLANTTFFPTYEDDHTYSFVQAWVEPRSILGLSLHPDIQQRNLPALTFSYLPKPLCMPF